MSAFFTRALAVAATCAAICVSDRARAVWVPIDDFEITTGTGTGGALASGNGAWSFIGTPSASVTDWRVVTDPAGGINRVLQLGGQNAYTMSKNIPGGDLVTNSEIGTLYFRFRIKNGSNASVGIGLADATVAPNPTDAAGWVNIAAVTGGTANETVAGISANAGGGLNSADTQTNIATNLSENVWYSMWMVNDNANNATQVYIQGGTAYPTQTQLGSGQVFRYNTPADLARVWLRPNINNDNDAEFFDDIWLDPTGENLVAPTAIALRGDFNGVGGITLVDFDVLKANFFATNALYSQGDFNLDQKINLKDFALFRDAYHAANPGAGALVLGDLAVPEPSTGFLLLAAAGLCATALRRHRLG